jgi:hypothetical protein
MHHHPNHNTAQTDPLLVHGAEITALWLRDIVRQQASSPSRVMDDLAYVLQTLLHEPVRSGQLRLERDHRLHHPNFSSAWYEVDLWIHDNISGASGAIDVDALSTHDRDPAEFLTSRRRWREIRRTGISLEVIAAEEVRTSPWRIGLEVVDLLGHVWTDLRPVELPAGVRAHAEALAQVSSDQARAAALQTNAPPSLPSLAEIRRELLTLPVPHDPDFTTIRRRHPRCGAPYTAREIHYLRVLHSAGLPARSLEEALLRPISALQRQLRKMG